jgi:hypothetical protein
MPANALRICDSREGMTPPAAIRRFVQAINVQADSLLAVWLSIKGAKPALLFGIQMPTEPSTTAPQGRRQSIGLVRKAFLLTLTVSNGELWVTEVSELPN